MITPWERTLLRSMQGDQTCIRTVYDWTPSKYRQVRGQCERRGYVIDGKITEKGAEALTRK